MRPHISTRTLLDIDVGFVVKLMSMFDEPSKKSSKRIVIIFQKVYFDIINETLKFVINSK